MTEIRTVMKDAGGVTKVARAMGLRPQCVCNWAAKGRIPEAHVLAWCRAVEWRRTPHQIAPHLYPHPLDGLSGHREAARICRARDAPPSPGA